MPDVIPVVDISARIKVDIIEQKMKAIVLIRAPQNDGEQPITYEDVMNELTKAGVKFGINEEALREVVGEQKYGEMFVAAVGTPAGIGEDASIEYHFLTYQSLKPQISENGHIEYKEVNVVNSVNKDDVLLKKIAAKIGSSGMNVCGEELPGKLGKDLNITIGPNTYKDPNDDSVIKAGTEGIIFFNQKSNSIEVQKLYVIQNSVDYSTGNVHVKSSIEIKGNVKPGFKVSTPYNVSVKGTVEHAVIMCDGNLTVKEGIVGDGKQIMTVGGDLHSGYINNQHIKCKGSVYAATEIRNSIIECEDEVVIVKVSGLIIGGKIIASKKISAPSVGNIYDVPTELEVGMNFEFKEKYNHKMELKNGVQKQIDEYRKNLDIINSKPPDLGSNNRLKSLKAQLQDAVDQMERLKRDIQEIEKDYFNISDPVICVTKTVFPGTLIKIKHAVFEVKEELTHVMFQIQNDQIECTRLK
jgi:uncharacterized protein (DUF342 family)